MSRVLGVAVCLLAFTPDAQAASGPITVTWDPSPDPAVTGYALHYGARPAAYTVTIDVGPQTQYQMPMLPDGTYYFVVQAYTFDGARSPYSNEVAVVVQAPPHLVRTRRRSDFNGDGFGDVLWRNKNNGALAAWSLDGTNVRVEAGLSHAMPDPNWEVVGTGDLNGDGKPDIVWRHKVYGFVGAWYMYGLTCVGVVSLSTPQVSDTAWKIAAVGDITGDGQADIVWQHDTGPLALWRMNGVTNLAGTALFGDPAMNDPRWRVVSIADMNGDGQMDLLWQHSNGGIATWLMFQGNVFGVETLTPPSEPDTGWKIVGTVDANYDGHADILWQHTDGRVSLWLMNRLTRVQNADIIGGSVAAPNWRIVGPR